MNTNNRNVRLQQHVVLLTVMEHAEELTNKKNTHTQYIILEHLRIYVRTKIRKHNVHNIVTKRINSVNVRY